MCVLKDGVALLVGPFREFVVGDEFTSAEVALLCALCVVVLGSDFQQFLGEVMSHGDAGEVVADVAGEGEPEAEAVLVSEVAVLALVPQDQHFCELVCDFLHEIQYARLLHTQ